MSTFPATIFVNSKPPSFINNPDVLVLEDHTIASVRKILMFFATKPIKSKTKLCIITDADKLLPPAQNALLKVLEEPGENNFIELYTDYPQELLPTIRSRSFLVFSPKPKSSGANIFDQALNLPDYLLQSEKLAADKDNLDAWLLSQIQLYKESLLLMPNSANLKTIHRLLKTRSMLKHNVDPKSALDWLFLG